MDQAAVPAVFNYQPIPAAVGGYYSQSKQPPSNGTSFQPGQWIQLPIVTGRIGQFYDPQRCYFMFRVLLTQQQVGPPVIPLEGLMLERVGAHAFFESVELWLNGQPLEQLQQYNCLMQLIRDQYYGLGRADVCADVEGCASENQMCVSFATSANATAALQNSAFVKASASAGFGATVDFGASIGGMSTFNVLGANTAGSVTATTTTISEPSPIEASPNAVIWNDPGVNYRWFAVPILSGLLGTLASKAFPALVFAPGSLFWQIKLAQPAAVGTRVTPAATANRRNGFAWKVYNTTVNWSIDSFNFVSGAVTLQSGVAATILSAAASGQLDLNTKSFTNVSASLAASSSAANIIVPLRKLSLNSIFVTFRDPARENASTATAASGFGGFLGRIAPTGCLAETFTAQWRFGNELIREYPYLQSVEFYVEVLRNLHEWMDKELNFCTALRPIRNPTAALAAGAYVAGQGAGVPYHPVGGFYATYADAAASQTCDLISQIVQNCGYFLALDLDVFSGSSSTSRSGRNTTGDQITINLTNGAATNGMFGARNMRVDFFGMHDLRVNIQAGGIAVPVS